MERLIRRSARSCALVLAAAACQGTPWIGYRFEPAPLAFEVVAPEDRDARSVSEVRVLGVSRDTGRVHVRVRIENVGTTPASFVPERCTLASRDLVSFESPELLGGSPRALPRGQAGTYELAFAPPAGRTVDDLDIASLNFRWTLDFAGVAVAPSTTFRRVDGEGRDGRAGAALLPPVGIGASDRYGWHVGDD